ncbi:hypothetical protein J6590_080895 [Homalodisca vitripennis]|nr:hypothetical protein J6590_080895 [Homalodisca vitripennis]
MRTSLTSHHVPKGKHDSSYLISDISDSTVGNTQHHITIRPADFRRARGLPQLMSPGQTGTDSQLVTGSAVGVTRDLIGKLFMRACLYLWPSVHDVMAYEYLSLSLFTNIIKGSKKTEIRDDINDTISADTHCTAPHITLEHP